MKTHAPSFTKPQGGWAKLPENQQIPEEILALIAAYPRLAKRNSDRLFSATRQEAFDVLVTEDSLRRLCALGWLGHDLGNKKVWLTEQSHRAYRRHKEKNR